MGRCNRLAVMAGTLAIFCALGACGRRVVAPAIGDITLTGINLDGTPGAGCSVGAAGPIPSTSTEIAISGVGFSTVPSNEVTITFEALGGETPFLGGTSKTVTVEGTVFSDTLICADSPEAVVCGPAIISAYVTVTLASLVSDDSSPATAGPVFTADFAGPTITALSVTCVGSLTPTALVITGTGFGDDGDIVSVRFTSNENLPAGDTIFSDGTTNSVDVQGTVGGGGTTVSTTTPVATNQVEGSPPGPANPLHRVSDPLEDATVGIILSNGSCTAAGVQPVIQFDRPEGDIIEAPGLANPNNVPQTVATAFRITGTNPAACPDAFAQVGAAVQVSFAAPGNPGFPANVFQLDASGNGTADFDVVDAVITSPTTIEGLTPACRAAVDFVPVVRVHFEDGTIVPVTAAFTWEAPPQISGIVNLDATTGNGVDLALGTGVFLPCVNHTMQITGQNFDNPNGTGTAVVALYDKNTGITRRLGTNNPIGLPANNDLGPVYTPTATTITGETRIEGLLAELDTDGDGFVQVTVRVTATDGQYAELDVTYQVASAVLNLSTAPGFTNNNCDISIDPTSMGNDFAPGTAGDGMIGANVFLCAGNDPNPGPGLFLFQGQDVFTSRSLDGGENWTNGTVGSNEDGYAAFEFRNFAMASYDAFGNLWMSYLVDDLTDLKSDIVMLMSADKGATWTDVSPATINSGPGGPPVFFFGAVDRPALATGPAVGGAQAAYVSFIDIFPLIPAPPLPAPQTAVLVAGRTAVGFNAVAATAGPVQVNNAPFGNANLTQHARCAVGNAGELYVTWNDALIPPPPPAGPPAPPQFFLLCDRDLDGLFGATFGFSPNDTPVDLITFPGGPRASTPDFGPPVPETDLCVVRAGAHAGRLVIAYEDVLPGQGAADVTSVITRTSDDFGFSFSAATAVHAVNTSDHYLPAICSDRTTGRLYVTWNDTSASPNNTLVQRLAAASSDGQTWSTSLQLTGATSSLAPAGDTEFSDYGLQSGIDALGGCVWAAWCETPQGAAPADRMDALVRAYQQKAGN